MPLSKRLAKINRYVANPLFRLIAGRVPPMMIIEHRGRTSGKTHRTPVMGWIANHELNIALTYGSDVDWVKNLQTAGGGQVVARGRTLTIGPPTLGVGLDQVPAIPAFIRRFLKLPVVDEYLRAPVSEPLRERRTEP
jgi:deazaflavin-dependent oxidoreductase (nitroreductase family)